MYGLGHDLLYYYKFIYYLELTLCFGFYSDDFIEWFILWFYYLNIIKRKGRKNKNTNEKMNPLDGNENVHLRCKIIQD